MRKASLPKRTWEGGEEGDGSSAILTRVCVTSQKTASEKRVTRVKLDA